MDDKWFEIFSDVTHHASVAGYREHALSYAAYREARELRDRARQAIVNRLGPDGSRLMEVYEELDTFCDGIETDAALWAGVRTAVLFFSLANNPAPLIERRKDSDELDEWRRVLEEIEGGARVGKCRSTA
jgi:hypothetical protein